MADRVLIVDDDIETLRLIGLMLQRQGYEILAATCGAQTLEMARAEKPGVILLDVMMPDMDGIEVTRRLRADPVTASIPILIFTARAQVEDKVAGYEAGVDDYLTKPTHPEELKAIVKNTLARAARQPAQPQQTPAARRPQGCLTAVLAAKGGVGSSTLTLNAAVAIRQRGQQEVVVAEMRPGCGSLGLQLGYVNPDGLRRLARLEPENLKPEQVEQALTQNASGIRVLFSSIQPRDMHSLASPEVYTAILRQLKTLAPFSLADFGTCLFPDSAALLEECDGAVVVLEPNPVTIGKTKALLEYLDSQGFGTNKPVTVALINRIRADVMLSWSQVQEALGAPLSVIITPAPELAYQADIRCAPMVLLQPDGLTAQQYGKLADMIIHQRVKPSGN